MEGEQQRYMCVAEENKSGSELIDKANAINAIDMHISPHIALPYQVVRSAA